jgi:hypothetical protein
MTGTGQREHPYRLRYQLSEIAILFSLSVGAMWLTGSITELRLYFAVGMAFFWAQQMITLDGIEETLGRLSDLRQAIREIERELSLMRSRINSN